MAAVNVVLGQVDEQPAHSTDLLTQIEALEAAGHTVQVQIQNLAGMQLLKRKQAPSPQRHFTLAPFFVIGVLVSLTLVLYGVTGLFHL